jgi:hypothetical protein
MNHQYQCEEYIVLDEDDAFDGGTTDVVELDGDGTANSLDRYTCKLNATV